jgi:hypothetical protein
MRIYVRTGSRAACLLSEWRRQSRFPEGRESFRWLALVVICAAGLAAATPSQAQFPGSGRPGFGNPGFPNQTIQVPGQGGTFQPGVAPGAFQSLLPHQTSTFMAYCGDLLATEPDSSVELAADPDAGEVEVGHDHMSILDAEQRGLLAVRGHDSLADAAPAAGQQWLDFHLVNRTPYVMSVRIDPGAVFTPTGQKRPEIDSHVSQLLTVERDRGLVGSPISVLAMWASRGFSAQDVAEQMFTPVAADVLPVVQQVLDTAGVQRRFDTGPTDYSRRYQRALAALGSGTTAVRLPLTLADGGAAWGLLTRNPAGTGVVDVTPASAPGQHLYYLATIKDTPGHFSVTLLLPRNDLPIPSVRPMLFTAPR